MVNRPLVYVWVVKIMIKSLPTMVMNFISLNYHRLQWIETLSLPSWPIFMTSVILIVYIGTVQMVPILVENSLLLNRISSSTPRAAYLCTAGSIKTHKYS